MRIGERRFLVFGHLVRTEDQGGRGYLATTYWVDVTDFAQVPGHLLFHPAGGGDSHRGQL